MYVLSTPLWPLGGEGQVRLFRMTRSMEEVMKCSFASTDYLDSRWDLHIYKGLRCTVWLGSWECVDHGLAKCGGSIFETQVGQEEGFSFLSW